VVLQHEACAVPLSPPLSQDRLCALLPLLLLLLPRLLLLLLPWLLLLLLLLLPWLLLLLLLLLLTFLPWFHVVCLPERLTLHPLPLNAQAREARDLAIFHIVCKEVVHHRGGDYVPHILHVTA